MGFLGKLQCMIDRPAHAATVQRLLQQFPVVALLGARQVGKTTLARAIAEQAESATFFDLENPLHVARLSDPLLALDRLRGLVVIDEVQRAPELFPVLRVLADRVEAPARFLVLGSASPELLRQSSESLAGRIAFHELTPLDLAEVGAEEWRRLWQRGGFPRSFLADDDAASARWRHEFTGTYLHRDLPELGIQVPGDTIRRFWTMLAHYHGQTWNGAELARAFGVAQSTVRRYLDILVQTYMVRSLDRWFENVARRQVKSPKVYLSDSGLLHHLLGIESGADLDVHPKIGASFEGFAIEQIVRALGARRDQCHVWGLHSGAELDLLVVRGRERLGFEIKHTAAPRTTRSMHSAPESLSLDRLDVVYVGDDVFPLTDRIRAVGIGCLLEAL